MAFGAMDAYQFRMYVNKTKFFAYILYCTFGKQSAPNRQKGNENGKFDQHSSFERNAVLTSHEFVGFFLLLFKIMLPN